MRANPTRILRALVLAPLAALVLFTLNACPGSLEGGFDQFLVDGGGGASASSSTMSSSATGMPDAGNDAASDAAGD